MKQSLMTCRMTDALPYPPPFQDLRTLALHTSLAETTIEKLVAANRFPPPRKNKCGKRLWVWKEVEEFLAAPEDTPLSAGEGIREATIKALRHG